MPFVHHIWWSISNEHISNMVSDYLDIAKPPIFNCSHCSNTSESHMQRWDLKETLYFFCKWFSSYPGRVFYFVWQHLVLETKSIRKIRIQKYSMNRRNYNLSWKGLWLIAAKQMSEIGSNGNMWMQVGVSTSLKHVMNKLPCELIRWVLRPLYHISL